MLGPQTHLAARYLDLLSQSQRVTASNIANVDTPGYRTKELDFGTALRAALDNPTANTADAQTTVRELGTLPVKNDGNDVVLERELQHLSETGIRFSHALLMLKGGIKSVRDAIHEGRG
jgi:flagellar basal-body rod protein FlgB